MSKRGTKQGDKHGTNEAKLIAFIKQNEVHIKSNNSTTSNIR